MYLSARSARTRKARFSNCENGIVKVRLADAVQTCLLQNLTAPAAPGNYDIRLLANNSTAVVLGACDILVVTDPR